MNKSNRFNTELRAFALGLVVGVVIVLVLISLKHM